MSAPAKRARRVRFTLDSEVVQTGDKAVPRYTTIVLHVLNRMSRLKE